MLILVGALIIQSCGSTQLVSTWKNPEHVLFHAEKVLLVGMTKDTTAREMFETKLQKEFGKRNVEAVRSLDVFDVKFTSSEKSEEEIDDVEKQLLSKDFDAILFTKVIGSETKKSFREKMSMLDKLYDTFSEDYSYHQGGYYEADYYDQFMVYHTEVSLYCICMDKERELIWRGVIHITDPKNISKTVQEYVKLIVLSLESQDLILRNPEGLKTKPNAIKSSI
ncbi:hypothetical protein [Spongiimicrobium salis]|uniref:hypothetical protein n=1 Tax=Spongiimicrobium salis TaxID=1667022 RepID=UPI00374D6787